MVITMWKDLGSLDIELLWRDLPSLSIQKERNTYIIAEFSDLYDMDKRTVMTLNQVHL